MSFLRKPFLAGLLLLLSLLVFGQQPVKSFELNAPGYTVYNSLYNTIRYIDSRRGDTAIGTIYSGVLRNAPAKLVFLTSMQTQLQRLVDNLIDSTAANGTLLFQLNAFHFTETVGVVYCDLNFNIYAADGGKYKRLSYLDTIIPIRSHDIAGDLHETAARMITDVIGRSLLTQPRGNGYTLDEVASIDSIDKQKIPLYTAATLKDGVYSTYKNFANQRPDMTAIVDLRHDESIASVKTGQGSENVKIKPANIYAVVYKGQPYVATQYGYYKLQRSDNNDFVFTGDIKVGGNNGLLSAGGGQATYVLMIDYRNGDFVHMQYIKGGADSAAQ